MARPSAHFAVALAVAALAVLPAGLAAEPFALPATLPLSAPEISLEVDFAGIEIVVDPRAAATLEAGLYADAAGPAPRLEAVGSGGVLSLRRAAGPPGSEEVPVWLSLVLHPDHRLRVRGDRLNLLLDATVPPGVESFGFRFPELEVTASEVQLIAVQGATLVARQSVVQLEATTLRVQLSVDGSTVYSERHDGALRIAGRNDEVRLNGHQGSLDFELHDSDVFLQDCEERLTGEAQGGSVLLGGFKGSASLTGREARIEVRGTGRDVDLDLRGEGLDVQVGRFHGTLTAELVGGSLTGNGLVGRITVTGTEQATVELSDLEKLATVMLRGGSFARIVDADGLVKVRLDDSELRAADIKILGFSAVGSQVTVDRATRVDTLTAVNSDLVLDLATVDDHPTLLLKGQSTASIRLPAPCRIRSVRRVDAGQIRTAGCEIEQTGAGYQLRSFDVVVLKTSLDPDSYLEVESAARVP